MRGVIDSDGCRVVANDRGVRSVRYHFGTDPTISAGCSARHSANSEFREPLPSGYQVAAYRKPAVALEEFAGPQS